MLSLLDESLDPALFTRHLSRVKEVNDEVNLVSRANVDAVLLQSLWESLVPMRDTKWRRGPRILDLGTGGGFPGMPFALADPTLELTLLDSRRAKTLSVQRIAEDLGAANVRVVHDRAETHAERLTAPYDTITTKAVSTIPEVTRWARGLIREGGTLLSWKGPEGAREVKAITEPGWKLLYALPVLGHRYVLVLQYGEAPGDDGAKDSAAVSSPDPEREAS